MTESSQVNYVYNAQTGEVDIIPLTQEEIDQINLHEAADAAEKQRIEEVRQSAVAKLLALGLSEEEISIVLGG